MKYDVAGASFNVQIEGAGDPVLFVHGFPLSGKLWEHQVAAMRGSHRLIVPDLRGLGQSTLGSAPDMARYADDLAAILDQVKINGAVTLVGLSMGGYVAFEFFRRHPKRLKALVLADTRADADPPAKSAERETLAQKVLKEGSKVVADGMAKVLFHPECDPALKKEWHTIMAASPSEGVAAALRAMGKRADSTPTLKTIKLPTCIIVGDKDVITPPEVAKAMHEAIPNSKLQVIPKSGHMTPVEQPGAFNKVLKEFLKS